MTNDNRRYFIVKHDLESLVTLPHYIWRIGVSSVKPPQRFDRVRIGDRWVSFAYIDNDRDRRPVSKSLDSPDASARTGMDQFRNRPWQFLAVQPKHG
jgi:hypothetical protein